MTRGYSRLKKRHGWRGGRKGKADIWAERGAAEARLLEWEITHVHGLELAGPGFHPDGKNKNNGCLKTVPPRGHWASAGVRKGVKKKSQKRQSEKELLKPSKRNRHESNANSDLTLGGKKELSLEKNERF